MINKTMHEKIEIVLPCAFPAKYDQNRIKEHVPSPTGIAMISANEIRSERRIPRVSCATRQKPRRRGMMSGNSEFI
ncbi:MAG: hypothetical protein A3G33_02945 [Omnitrophica bacterium RIFCSPLOWO2_12_FULL_44_17]|uniref:Uncharacterized protein n=1 Tax=Candidatus Danuiimicrobium aquiferis TaxID=1801832 RepID=A0A1G1KVH4_9BACT|nr:MAG: hypothetical protein A3B72_04425 [Omnitrophica bacterium RIFCSPHIGHO2_02_FULL_45_28]OGW90428.1 MAG: hypothetical protein A3E74_04240 [Omnitrophica bacterium RIFCSPHIGHO2_12_FULL_44_12]OGW96936.1 MAG: hypothetical protein A3G33_02945 [Omnitrophica bacterium RIFCSPLOWO2_12_FULL_44_17]OGX03928.1 MAG: hypothetical protein A3J12_03470 [Omnitrophica bacterium RIFCSPLOWO2_02_FULL_44_11]